MHCCRRDPRGIVWTNPPLLVAPARRRKPRWRLESKRWPGCNSAGHRTAKLRLTEGAKFDTGDVLEFDDGAIGIFADDDVAKLFRGDETSLSADGVGHRRTRRRGISSHLTGGIHDILLIERVDEIVDGEAELGENLRLNPDAHGIVGGSEKN